MEDLKDRLVTALIEDYDVERADAVKAVEKWLNEVPAGNVGRLVYELAEEIYETEEYWNN